MNQDIQVVLPIRAWFIAHLADETKKSTVEPLSSSLRLWMTNRIRRYSNTKDPENRVNDGVRKLRTIIHANHVWSTPTGADLGEGIGERNRVMSTKWLHFDPLCERVHADKDTMVTASGGCRIWVRARRSHKSQVWTRPVMWSRSDHLRAKPSLFQGGPGACSPRKILKIEMLRYAFSALLGVFLSLNKGSKLLSWIVTKLKSPTVRFGWVGLFYICENQLAFYEHHTSWAGLSPDEHRCVLVFSLKSFPSMAAETVTTSRNSNAVETRLVSTPCGSCHCIRLELDLDGLKMLVDSSTGSLVEPERTSGSWTVVRSDCTWLYLIDSFPWHGGIPSTGDTLSGALHHFSQTSLTLWPPDPRIEGAFRYCQRSYYYV